MVTLQTIASALAVLGVLVAAAIVCLIVLALRTARRQRR